MSWVHNKSNKNSMKPTIKGNINEYNPFPKHTKKNTVELFLSVIIIYIYCNGESLDTRRINMRAISFACVCVCVFVNQHRCFFFFHIVHLQFMLMLVLLHLRFASSYLHWCLLRSIDQLNDRSHMTQMLETTTPAANTSSWINIFTISKIDVLISFLQSHLYSFFLFCSLTITVNNYASRKRFPSRWDHHNYWMWWMVSGSSTE